MTLSLTVTSLIPLFFFFLQVSVKSNNGTDKDVICTRGKYCNYFPVNVAEYRIVD